MKENQQGLYDLVENNEIKLLNSGSYDDLIISLLNLNHFSEKYKSTFSLLDFCRSVEMVKLLQKKGGDIFKVNVFGDSLLHTYVNTYIHDYSVNDEIISVFEYFVKCGLDIKWKNSSSRNVHQELEFSYYQRCSKKNERIVDKFKEVMNKFKHHDTSSFGHLQRFSVSKLNQAINSGNLNFIESNCSLLDFNYVDYDGKFPLLNAFENKNDDYYKILIEKRASPNIKVNGNDLLNMINDVGTDYMRSCHFTKSKIRKMMISDIENGTYCLVGSLNSNKILYYRVYKYRHEVIGDFFIGIEYNATSGLTDITYNSQEYCVKKCFKSMLNAIKFLEDLEKIFKLNDVHDAITTYFESIDD